MIKVAFPTDEHFPYQDERARDLALQIVQDFQPDLRICGSDGMDFYSVSGFDKDPERLRDGGLQREIDGWMAGQREWDSAAPNAKKFFLVGNHEARLARYLYRHPELFDLEALRLPNLLKLKEQDVIWEWDKKDAANLEISLYGRLLVRHGEVVRKHSAYSAKAELEREFYAISIMTGHTHRGGSHYVTTRAGLRQAHECFCLCRLDPPYLQNPNWQQGIVLAEVSQVTLLVEPIPFSTVNGKLSAIWRGKQYVSDAGN